MADIKKIDTYFNEQTPLIHNKEKEKRSKHSARVRMVKLVLPVIAAILASMLVVLPYLKNTQKPLHFDITAPKKGELEKLHIENTRFNITDADNKVSTFTADNIDETEPKSKVVKLVNPKGKIPLKNGTFADVKSPSGFYDQANNRITMIEDVFINYNDETNVETSHVTYDFNEHRGKGNAKIVADGIYGRLEGQSYEFDTTNEIYKLFGKSAIDVKRKPNDIFIRASKSIVLYKLQEKTIITGNAYVKEGDNELYADKIELLYKEENKQHQIRDMKAFGHVKLISPKGQISADRGIYNPKTEFLELFDNVIIEQNGNKIFGDYATSDLKTGISKIISHNSAARVRGVFKKNQNKNGGGKR